MIGAETYWALLHDPAHWAMEATVEVVTGVLVFPLARAFGQRWVKRHDEEQHGR